jgi:HSP20 family protein
MKGSDRDATGGPETATVSHALDRTARPAGTRGLHADLSELLEVRRNIEVLAQSVAGAGEGSLPVADLLDIGDGWQVRCELPGVELDDLELAVHGETLIIAGVRTPIEPGVRVLMQERSAGAFERRIDLPGPLRVAELTAHLRSGLLIIDLPKAARDDD